MDLVYSPNGFIKVTNIGDTVHINIHGSEIQGIVTAVTWKGVNVRTQHGTFFYKWCHVRKIIKEKFTII